MEEVALHLEVWLVALIDLRMVVEEGQKAQGGQGQALGSLGKGLLFLNMTKDSEIENGLGEIRRGSKLLLLVLQN